MLLAMNEYVNALGRLIGIDINMPHIEVPTLLSLTIIFGVLALSMLLSVVITRKKRQEQ
jgi:tellurite resistance protein TerC